MSQIIVDVNSINDIYTDVNQFTESYDSIKFIINEDVKDMSLYISTKHNGSVNIICEDNKMLKRGTDSASGKEYLEWKFASSISGFAGAVSYQIVGAKLNADGNYDKVWLSDEGRIIVKESIDTDDYVEKTAKKSPSLFMTLYLTIERYLQKVLVGEFQDAVKTNCAKVQKLPEANEENRGKIISIYTETKGDKIYFCAYLGYDADGHRSYGWKELAFVTPPPAVDPSVPEVDIE